MKVQYIYLTFLFAVFSLGGFAQQTGINTKNPKGALHVDAKKNNATTGTPTAAETDDDFIVDVNGNVGIGLLAPSVKLHLKSALSPALTIADGTQGAGKILSSDANGVGTWVTPPLTKTSVLGDFSIAAALPSASYPKSDGTATPVRSYLSMSLSPGKWAVNLGLVFDQLGTNTFWQEIYLSSDPFTIKRDNFTQSTTLVTDPLYGGVLTGSVLFTPNTPADERKGFVTGRAIITITGSSASTIYLIFKNQSDSGTSYRFNPLAPENYLYAFPLN